MPGDLIPYKLLSLFVVLLLLNICLVKEIPVLKVAAKYGLSFQIINLYLKVFFLFENHIHQYFRETALTETPVVASRKSIIGLIKKPYTLFQRGYAMLNRHPCFMSKFFDGSGAPPIGFYAPLGAAT
jgi:hypothetical protein